MAVKIINNTFERCGTAIHFEGDVDADLSGNAFRDCGKGIVQIDSQSPTLDEVVHSLARTLRLEPREILKTLTAMAKGGITGKAEAQNTIKESAWWQRASKYAALVPLADIMLKATALLMQQTG